VCSAHFVSGNKSDDPLSPDYTPSVFSYVGSPDKRRAKRQLERYKQRKHSKGRRLEYSQKSDDAAEGIDVDPTVNGVAQTHAVSTRDSTITDTPRLVSTTTMTDVTSRYIKALEDECLRSTGRLDKYSKPNPLSQDAFKDDDQKVNFYTGLPSFQILRMVIFNFVSPHVKHGSSKTHALSKFEEFIATLMKLRLGLFDQDLAYRFGVHQSTISRNFRKWIDAMFTRLKPLIKWPEREELQKTLPLDFRAHFKKCVVIIDCFEIFCERPKSLKARAQTYSNYKHHNTVKFLIGIAPQGSITFISKGWGGRISDQYLTENCGILNQLLPGDQILADRGFNIQETVGLYCAEVKLPPFTKGKKTVDKKWMLTLLASFPESEFMWSHWLSQAKVYHLGTYVTY